MLNKCIHKRSNYWVVHDLVMQTLNGKTNDLVITDLMTWWLDNYHVNFWTSIFWSVGESVIHTLNGNIKDVWTKWRVDDLVINQSCLRTTSVIDPVNADIERRMYELMNESISESIHAYIKRKHQRCLNKVKNKWWMNTEWMMFWDAAMCQKMSEMCQNWWFSN